MSAAIFMSGVSSWNSELFRAGLEYIGPALPTAASALSPTKRPTMMLSTVLYSCWAILPISMGMEKRMIWVTGFPSRISTA